MVSLYWSTKGYLFIHSLLPYFLPHAHRSPDVKSWLIWKDPDAGKDWGWEEKGMMEDEMVGWHHWLDGRGFGWTLGVGDGQGGLACCAVHGVVRSWTWLSDWTELKILLLLTYCMKCIHLGKEYHTSDISTLINNIILQFAYPLSYWWTLGWLSIAYHLKPYFPEWSCTERILLFYN